MTALLNVAYFAVACIVLIKSASTLVRHLPRIASYFKLNEFAIGFIVMAISTTLPELFVGISSALAKNTALGLGNALGSVIADLTIIIGIVALFNRKVRIQSHIIRKDLIYMFVILLLPIVMMLWPPTWLRPAGQEPVAIISRVEGAILLCVFLFYIYMTARQERMFHRGISLPTKQEATVSALVTLFMVVLLFASSRFVVLYGTRISDDFHVPPLLVGILLIALGTSLPELTFQLRAVAEKHEELAIGDMVGAVVANSTLVIGVTALISPVTANFFLFFTSAIFMVVYAFIFLTFAESDGSLNWKEGLSLIMLYVFFVVVESYIKTLQ